MDGNDGSKILILMVACRDVNLSLTTTSKTPGGTEGTRRTKVAWNPYAEATSRRGAFTCTTPLPTVTASRAASAAEKVGERFSTTSCSENPLEIPCEGNIDDIDIAGAG